MKDDKSKQFEDLKKESVRIFRPASSEGLREPKKGDPVPEGHSPEIESLRASERVSEGAASYNHWTIQPGYFIEVNKLPYWEGSIIKRLLSALESFDNGDRAETIEELNKAKHEIELILEWRLEYL